MSVNYKSLSKHPLTFLRLTGLKVNEFNNIVKIIKPIYKRERLKRVKDNTGRISNIKTIEDKLICLFIYYRCYISYLFLGYLFNLHESNICRLFKILEPIVAKRIHIEKDKTLTKEIVEQLIIDATEQPIQRPKNRKKQKQYYSGKKKRHTIKKQVIIDSKNGKIKQISKDYKGKKHDFSIFKDKENLKKLSLNNTNLIILADSGYQGIDKYKNHTEIPIKRHKIKDNNGNIITKTGLTEKEKEHNHNLSSKRIKVENKIRELKIFKILSDIYRNFTKKHDLRFNIIAGLVNYKNGFLQLR
jgi:hypothetical protein